MPKYFIDPDGKTDEVRTNKGIAKKGQWVDLPKKEAERNPNLISEESYKKIKAKFEGGKDEEGNIDEDGKDEEDKKKGKGTSAK